jgi:hypothetical protein
MADLKTCGPFHTTMATLLRARTVDLMMSATVLDINSRV